MLFIFHVMSNKIKRLQKYNSVQSKVVLNLATIIHIKESYLHAPYFLKCSFNSLVRKAIGLLCNRECFAFTSQNLGLSCLVNCFLSINLNQDLNFSCFRGFFLAKLRQSSILLEEWRAHTIPIGIEGHHSILNNKLSCPL